MAAPWSWVSASVGSSVYGEGTWGVERACGVLPAGLGPGPGGYGIAQAPSWRVRLRFRSRLRLIAAARVFHQALFLATPR